MIRSGTPRIACIILVVAGAFGGLLDRPAAAQPRPGASASSAPRIADITKNGVITLVRSTLIALDQANKTGNYTVLRDLGSPQFQSSNTAARLADIFAGQRRSNLDLSGIVAIDPVLNGLPQIESNGMMRLNGFFPSVPQQINFELLYAPVAGQWKLFGLSVNVGGSGPVAPSPPATEAPTPPSQTTSSIAQPAKKEAPAASPPAASPRKKSASARKLAPSKPAAPSTPPAASDE